MKNAKVNKFLSWIKSSSSDFYLFVLILILLNLVVSRAFFRIDLTAPKTYSLSSSSKELVKTIEEPMSIKVFFSRNLPSPYSEVEQYVKDILVEYKNSSNKNFNFEYFNMEKEENIQQAEDYGLSQIQIREVKNNEVGYKNVFMGLVITYADQIEVLDGITGIDGLEYELTNTIGRIISNTNILSGLNGSIKAILYKSESLNAFRISGFDDIESSVQNALKSLNKKYQDKLIFEQISPDTNESLNLQQKYGVQYLSWVDKNGTENGGAIGLVLEYADKFRLIPLQMQNMIFTNAIVGLDTLEEEIDKNLKALVSKTSTVAYITGHGELDLNNKEQGAAVLKSLCEDIYTLENINLSEKDIPAGIQNIIINGPKSKFSDEELYKLDQFLMKGGNLTFFMDPFEVIEQKSQNPYYAQPPMYKPISTGLEKLFEKYGILCGKNYVMDKACLEQQDQRYGKLSFNYVPMIRKENLNQKNSITKNMGLVYFLQAGTLDISKAQENKKLKSSVLVKTSPESWIVSDQFILSPLYNNIPEDESSMKSENLAAILEGEFESAFETSPLENANTGGISSKTH